MSKTLCCVAFESLYSKISGGYASTSLEKFESVEGKIKGNIKKAPLFITWNKNGQLRGCIGTFLDHPIVKGTEKFALTAGLQDPRFPPISRSELGQLSVSVTILANFTAIHNSQDWVIGEHGLKLGITKDGQHFLGTFLPSVAEEQEWDKLNTLWYLLKKADYEGVLKAHTVEFYDKGLKEGWLELVKYDGLKELMENSEFVAIKNSIE